MSQKLLIDADLVGNAQGSDTKAETELAAMFSEEAVLGKAFKFVEDAEGNVTVLDSVKTALAINDLVDSQEFTSALQDKANTDFTNLGPTALANAGVDYRVIYGTGQKAVYDPTNTKAIEDDALGTNGTIVNDSRYVLENPFGADTPVLVAGELLENGVWANTGYYSTSTLGRGAQARFVQGTGIVVQTGLERVSGGSSYTLGGHGNIISRASAPYRVHVWKIGA